jgi:hypothetical protein
MGGPMSIALGEKDYRAGGLQRLQESEILRDEARFAGSVYLAGRAVESLLRALIWKFDNEISSGRRSLETGPDLRELLARVIGLGVLAKDEERDELATMIQWAGRLWFNNMRFLPTKRLEVHWLRLGAVNRKQTLKQAVFAYYNVCATIAKRCEVLCQR